MFHFRPEFDGVGGKSNLIRIRLFYLFSFITLGFYLWQAFVIFAGLPVALSAATGLDVGPLPSLVIAALFGFVPVVGNLIASFAGAYHLDLAYGVSFGLFVFVGLGLFVLTYAIHPSYVRHRMAYHSDPIYRKAYDDTYLYGNSLSRKSRLEQERSARNENERAAAEVRQAMDYNAGENDDPENAQLADFIKDVQSSLKR